MSCFLPATAVLDYLFWFLLVCLLCFSKGKNARHLMQTQPFGAATDL